MSTLTNGAASVAEQRARRRTRARDRARQWDRVAVGALWATGGLVVAVLLYIVVYTVVRGLPHTTLRSLVSSDPTTGLAPQLFNTFYLLILSMIPMLIVGVGAAIYLVEYARQGPLVSVLRFATETLTSVPSVVIGLRGFLLFVTNFGEGQRWGFSRIAGALTLAILNLPWMLRTVEDALRAVPATYREASLAMGATRLQTIWRIVLPAAIPGLVTAILVVAGRVIGESAALIFTAGEASATTGWQTPQVAHVAGDTLAVHIYALFADNPTPQSQAGQTETAFVLIVLVLAINLIARVAGQKLSARFNGR